MYFASEEAAAGKGVSPGPQAVGAVEAGLALVAASQIEGNLSAFSGTGRAGYMTDWELLKMTDA